MFEFWEGRMLPRLSPWGWAVAGAALVVVGFPAIKKTARAVAVTATKAALTVNDQVRGLSSNLKEEWDELVAEAQEKRTESEKAIEDNGQPNNVQPGGEPA